jgi:hypothetical protein
VRAYYAVPVVALAGHAPACRCFQQLLPLNREFVKVGDTLKQSSGRHHHSSGSPRAVLTLMLSIFALTAVPGSAAGAEGQVVILDSLNGRDPSVSISIFGTGGLSVFSAQHSGPEFVITVPTVITEIGGFVNNCRTIVSFIPNCPNASPFVVEIRPSQGGVPDKDVVIASYQLTHDANPLAASYEFAQPNLLLGPGAYFALFAPSRTDDAGYLPDFTGAEPMAVGFVNPGVSAGTHIQGMGVRVIGSLATPPLLPAIADTYVRGGVWAATNFGAAPVLRSKKGVSPDNTRRSYLKFDIGRVTNVARATLRVYGHLSDTSTRTADTTVYAVRDVLWGERTLTWNTRADLGAVLGRIVVEGVAPRWFELDVTAFVRAEHAAGHNVVSFALRNVMHTSAYAEFASRESGSVAPQLVIGQ